LYGKYISPQSPHLLKRNKEIAAGTFNEEMSKLTKMELDELKKIYSERDTEK